MQIVKNAAGLHECSIGKHTYEFVKWNADESLDALLDISIVVGKPLAVIAERGGVTADLNRSAIECIVESLTDNLAGNRQMVMNLVKKLATNKMYCDGKEVGSFTAHYEDRLSHAFEVVTANLNVQFKHFFLDIAARMPKHLKQKEANKTDTITAG